jgi:capsular exopolysaccharide synthesis family protein
MNVVMQSEHIDKALVSLAAPASFAAEQYRGLRLKIERLQHTRGLRVLAVTSPGVNDGKTVTSINLAAAFAHRAGARVLLIDADLRRPSVEKYLGLGETDGTGLAGALGDERIELRQVVRQAGGTSTLSILPAGPTPAAVHELLESPRFENLLREAREQYDLVILDTPPLVPVFDAVVLSRLVDGVLIVVAAHETPRKQLEEALNLLDEPKVLGIVFNGDNSALSGRYDKYYER